MKKVFVVATLLTFCTPFPARTQDAATEERLKQLSGRIEDLIASQEAQRKQIERLSRELESVRDQQSKPNTSYAAQEDVKRLAEVIREVDRKRIEDNERITTALEKIKKTLETSMKPARNSGKDRDPSRERDSSDRDHGSSNSGKSDKGATASPSDKGFFEYTVQSGDTLSAIIAAYKEKGIKVTEKQIREANPGLVPEKMKIGQKISIPAPDK